MGKTMALSVRSWRELSRRTSGLHGTALLFFLRFQWWGALNRPKLWSGEALPSFCLFVLLFSFSFFPPSKIALLHTACTFLTQVPGLHLLLVSLGCFFLHRCPLKPMPGSEGLWTVPWHKPDETFLLKTTPFKRLIPAPWLQLQGFVAALGCV